MPQSINRVSNQRSRTSVARVASMHEHITRTYRVVLFSLATFAAMTLVLATVLRAQEAPASQVPPATINQMQEIISAQIDAFLAEDADAAYAFAAEPIKMRFPTANMFVRMVEQGYPAVYAPQSFSFAASALTPEGPAQQVEFVGEDGQVWRGLYTFAEEDDGNLLISGVFLRRQNERQI